MPADRAVSAQGLLNYRTQLTPWKGTEVLLGGFGIREASLNLYAIRLKNN